MSQAPAMPVFTDALIGDTTHLSTEEFGAYCLILFATWRNSGVAFLDNDRRLARICRATEARWRGKLRAALVGFFDLSAGTWRQKRLEKEWNFVAEKVRVNRENGKLGGRRKPLGNNDPPKPNGPFPVNPDHNPNESTQTHSHIQEEFNKKGAGSSRAGARAGGVTFLSAAERKARWQSRMMQEAQATTTPRAFGKLVAALMEDPLPRWAKAELERLDQQIKRRKLAA